MLHKAICTVTGHPVDVASGTFFTDEEDFWLDGQMCIRDRGDGGIYDHRLTFREGVTEVLDSHGELTVYHHLSLIHI